MSDTVKTLVISADVADHEQYKKIRVNGDLSKVLKNLEMLNESLSNILNIDSIK